MFKNLTALPLKVLDIIPDLIDQNPEPAVKEALLEKEITFEGSEIEDVCPTPDLSAGDRLKQLGLAKKRSNARCYPFLRSVPTPHSVVESGRRCRPAASTSPLTRSSAALGRARRSSTGPATAPRGPSRGAERS